MKKIFIIGMLAVCGEIASATGDKPLTLSHRQVTYTIVNAHDVSVRQCHDRSEEVFIPDSIYNAEDGITYRVIGIEPHAFSGCHQLEKISLPATIEYIGAEALEGTAFHRNKGNWDEEGRLWVGDALISVKNSSLSAFYAFPAGTRIIAAGVLGDNGKVRRLILPEGIHIIPEKAFVGCRKLRYIQIPHSVIKIGRDAFLGTTLYDSDVNWTNGILYADSCAVGRRSIPQDLTLRNGTRLMSDGLLQGNRTLRNIHLPEEMEQVSREAFADCKNLQFAFLPDGIKTIGEQAFRGCHNLQGGNLFPSSLQRIGAGAFYECASLDGVVTLPNQVEMIPAACFFRCESLKYIAFNPTCRYIGLGAFIGCTGLEELVLPEALQGMDTGAFSGCTSIQRTDLSKCQLTIIPSYAFSGCSQLREVVLPSVCARIGKESFSYCPNLTSIAKPDSISIHPEAFIGTPITVSEE